MDTFKVGTYSDVPNSLEKGCPTTGTQPLPHSEACHTCSTTTPRRSLVKRRWRIAFSTIALIWLVFSYGRHTFWHNRLQAWRWSDNRVGYPPPPDGDINRQCVGSTNWTTYYDQPPWTPKYPHGAETTFSLPLDSDALYLISRGAYQRGLVNIKQSTQIVDTVDVRVRVAYFNDIALELASVCQIERADGEYGVGIFTPPWPRSPRHMEKTELEFDVTLTLPAGSDGPLSVKKLETNMPNYIQDVADLEESVVFDLISLTSANGRISVQSATFEVGQFSSLNGEIDGNFNAGTFLDLHTANGGITPTVSLSHYKGADPSNLVIRSINGQINAEISLMSDAPTGGEFAVNAQSSNGEIKLQFVDSPVGSDLRCQAEATVGGVEIELDSAFEGTYTLENVMRPKLVTQHDVEDPAGRGRRRVVSVEELPGRVVGEIKWVENDGSSSGIEGYVALKTVFSPLTLIV
ncbi:hypothetical protein L210DRAFT_1053927 [Boletus edulis BED1]|uniref:DUF7330 domain-containing protein n=1 Tax=Boletus edulis BED1 TaxID=1328754 RepID=A0AAD4BNL9_BOLED|nr:hypothetical protein L210DRAFT_1053927 [Boletus edulis BED1]